ncbi:hypothetical protein ACI2OX_16515 [Bacillus sp. N9]
MIKSNDQKFQQLVQALLKKETLDGVEVQEIVAGKISSQQETIVYA